MKPRSYYLDYSLLAAPRPFLCSSHPAFQLSHPVGPRGSGFLAQQIPLGFSQWEALVGGQVGGWRRGICPPFPSLVAAGPATAVAPLCVACALPPLSPACRPSGLLVPPRLWGRSQLLGHFSRGFTSHLPIAQRGPFPKISSPKAPISVSCQDLDTFTCFILPANRPCSFMSPILR